MYRDMAHITFALSSLKLMSRRGLGDRAHTSKTRSSSCYVTAEASSEGTVLMLQSRRVSRCASWRGRAAVFQTTGKGTGCPYNQHRDLTRSPTGLLVTHPCSGSASGQVCLTQPLCQFCCRLQSQTAQ